MASSAPTPTRRSSWGVALDNEGSDQGEMVPMLGQLAERYQRLPHETLVDGGFANKQAIEAATAAGTTVYAPVQKPKDPTRDPHTALAEDSPAVAASRTHGHRVGTGSLQAARLHRRVRQRPCEKSRTVPIHRAGTTQGENRAPVVCARPQPDARRLPAPSISAMCSGVRTKERVSHRCGRLGGPQMSVGNRKQPIDPGSTVALS
jgi:hypothetical protein